MACVRRIGAPISTQPRRGDSACGGKTHNCAEGPTRRWSSCLDDDRPLAGRPVGGRPQGVRAIRCRSALRPTPLRRSMGSTSPQQMPPSPAGDHAESLGGLWIPTSPSEFENLHRDPGNRAQTRPHDCPRPYPGRHSPSPSTTTTRTHAAPSSSTTATTPARTIGPPSAERTRDRQLGGVVAQGHGQLVDRHPAIAIETARQRVMSGQSYPRRRLRSSQGRCA